MQAWVRIPPGQLQLPALAIAFFIFTITIKRLHFIAMVRKYGLLALLLLALPFFSQAQAQDVGVAPNLSVNMASNETTVGYGGTVAVVGEEGLVGDFTALYSDVGEDDLAAGLTKQGYDQYDVIGGIGHTLLGTNTYASVRGGVTVSDLEKVSTNYVSPTLGVNIGNVSTEGLPLYANLGANYRVKTEHLRDSWNVHFGVGLTF